MHPGLDSSTDKEVMAILSSPGRQKLVKPQPRPGALATTVTSLRPLPSESIANGKVLPDPAAVAASSGSDYSSEAAVAVPIGGGGEASRPEVVSAREDSVGASGSSTSPPHMQVLPKSISASWDPQVQSSSSAFSVPAGRVAGRGDKPDTSQGVGGRGSAGLGGLTLGGFRMVGDDLADPKAGEKDDEGHRQGGGGGGRTPGPTKFLRYPLEASTLGRVPPQDKVLLDANAVEAPPGGRERYSLVYDGAVGGYGQRNHRAIPGADSFSVHGDVLRTSGSMGADEKAGAEGSGSRGRLGRRGNDMPSLSGSLEGSLSAADFVTPAATTTAASVRQHPPQKDEAEVMCGDSFSLKNWGIMQYGLTLEDPVTDADVDGSSEVAGEAGENRLRHSREISDGNGGGGRGGNGGDSGGGGEASSSSSASVAMMMDSLSLRDSRSRDGRYPGEAGTRDGASATSRSFLYGSRVEAGDGGRPCVEERRRTGEDVVLAGDFGLAALSGAETGADNADFSFLGTRSGPSFDPGIDARGPLLHHQQKQHVLHSHRSNALPLHPRRVVGRSPSIAPMRRRLPPPSEAFESEKFAPAPGGANVGRSSDAWRGSTGSGGGSVGGVNEVTSSGTGLLRWSFPPPSGIVGHVGGPSADDEEHVGVTRLSGFEQDGGGTSARQVGGGSGGRGGSGECRDVRDEWGGNGMRSVLAIDYGVSRRLFCDADKGHGGGDGIGDGTARSKQPSLSGSVDSHQFAMMRGQHRGFETDHRIDSSCKGVGGETLPDDGRVPGQNHFSVLHHTRFSLNLQESAPKVRSDYDDRGAATRDRGGMGGVDVGGGGDVAVSGNHVHASARGMSALRHGGGVTGAPPGFPTMFEYLEHSRRANGGKLSDDDRGGGGVGSGHVRALLPRTQQQREQQQLHEQQQQKQVLEHQHRQQQQQQQSLEQQQHHGGAPIPHAQVTIPPEHLQLHAAPARPLRTAGESMRCQPDVPLGPAEGLSWESAGPPERGVRGISGGSAGEMDFVDPATRRMTYEVSSGHLAGPLHAGYETGFDAHEGEGVPYEGGVSSVPFGGGGKKSGCFDPPSRVAYESSDGREESLSYDVGGGGSYGFSGRYNGPSRVAQSGGYENALPQPPADHGYRGGGVDGTSGARYPGAELERSGGHRHQRSSRDYQHHPDFQQLQQHHHSRQAFSPPDRKKPRANLGSLGSHGYSPPEHATSPPSSSSSALPRPHHQHPQDLPWSPALPQHHHQHHQQLLQQQRQQQARGPPQPSYPPHQYPQQQQQQQQQSMTPKSGSWGGAIDSRAGIERRGASGLSVGIGSASVPDGYAVYGSSPPGRRIGGAPGQSAQSLLPSGGAGGTPGGGVGSPAVGDVYGRRAPSRLPSPGVPGHGALGQGGYGLTSPRVHVAGGGGSTQQQQQQQQLMYSPSASHAPLQDAAFQDRRMPYPQQKQQQQSYREASSLRDAANGPQSALLSGGPGSISGPPSSSALASAHLSEQGHAARGTQSSSSSSHGSVAVSSSGGQARQEVGGGSRGSSPHRPRMYPTDPPPGVGRYAFSDVGGGVMPREGAMQRSIPHGAAAAVQQGGGGYGRPPAHHHHNNQHNNQQQHANQQNNKHNQQGGCSVGQFANVHPSGKGHLPHPTLHSTALRHPGGSSSGLGGSRGGGGGGTMVPVPGAPMDETQVKRAELVESPTTRLAFKDFYRAFRAKEKTSFHAAKVFAMECFNILPPKVHWRLYLEIADLARRENRFVEARKLYRKVTKLQPFASQGWVEYCKLEEEFGDLSRCSQILRRGLTFCEYSETLLIKAVKQEERAGNLDGARELLSRLKHVGIDNVWRTVLEGALLEARSGNTDVARKVLKYLMTHVPWYGPIYYEAFRLEEKAEHFESALAIVERGLQEIPRYGPLWFGAFRLSEKLDMRDAKRALAEGQSPYEDLYRTGKVCTRAKKTLQKAKDCISKELVWKVHFEAAQIEERLASVCAKEVASRSMAAAAMAQKRVQGGPRSMRTGPGVLYSPSPTTATSAAGDDAENSEAIIADRLSDLSLQGRRSSEVVGGEESEKASLKTLEILEKNGRGVEEEEEEEQVEVVTEARARDSLLGPCRASYAHAVLSCPLNLRWKVWLAGARMELAAGNCSHAQRLLNRAFQEVPEKSKSHVFLECARLEEFTGNLDSARQILQRARVETKSEWKVFLESVLLEIRANDWQRAAAEAQEALRVHSGAGRLWAVLVQLKQRDSDEAQQASLKQALKEVPKSGEVWCEGARIHLNPLSKAFDLDIAGKYLGFAVQFTPQYGDSFMECLRLGLLNDLFLPRALAIADAWQGAAASRASGSGSEFDPLSSRKEAEESCLLAVKSEGWRASAECPDPAYVDSGSNDSGSSCHDSDKGENRAGPGAAGAAEVTRGDDVDAATGADAASYGGGDGGEGGSSTSALSSRLLRDDASHLPSKPAVVAAPTQAIKSRARRRRRSLLSPEMWAAIDAGEHVPGGAGSGDRERMGGSYVGGLRTRSSETAEETCASLRVREGGGTDSDSAMPAASCRDSGRCVRREDDLAAGEKNDGVGERCRVRRSWFHLSQGEMAAASRLTEGDILRAHVEDLLLRCINADPNYGSMWFHCRHRPSDTAKSILMMAKVMMADELTKLQDVYLLAVTRHVILQREVDAYMASTTSSSSGDAGEAVEEQALRQTRSRVSRSRRREKMEDRRERLLAAAAREAPPVAFENPGQGNPMGVRPEDFVTGLASLNRITAQMGRLRSEDRRKILFGSDQIVP